MFTFPSTLGDIVRLEFDSVIYYDMMNCHRSEASTFRDHSLAS